MRAALLRAACGPCAVGEPRRARRARCARTGRSCGRPLVVGDARSGMVRGVADRRRLGREGNASGGNPLMHDREQSDRPVVPAKPPNNPGRPGAEVVEGRGLPEGNAASETCPGCSAGQGVSSDLDRVRQVARKDGDVRFTALLHHVSVDRLREAYRAISPDAAAGVDGVTWRDYGHDLEANLSDLHARVARGAYRARPTRRVFIPKPDGRLRPLGVASLEDKILQRAVAEVLNAVFEQDFWVSHTGFGPLAQRMMRWTRSRSGSRARR